MKAVRASKNFPQQFYAACHEISVPKSSLNGLNGVIERLYNWKPIVIYKTLGSSIGRDFGVLKGLRLESAIVNPTHDDTSHTSHPSIVRYSAVGVAVVTIGPKVCCLYSAVELLKC